MAEEEPISESTLHPLSIAFADADGYAVAQAIGRSPEIALDNARSIISAVNGTSGGK